MRITESDIHFIDAKNLYAKGEYKEAVKEYTKAIEIDPKEPIAYYERGLSYNKLEKIKEANIDYTSYLLLNADDHEVYYLRGSNYFTINKVQLGIKDLRKAIALAPNNLKKRFYCFVIAEGFRASKQYTFAIEYILQGLEFQPNNPEGYRFLSRVYNETEDYDKAIDYCTIGITLLTDDEFFYLNRGHAYFKCKEYKLALEDFNKALEIDDNNAWGYYGRGEASLELNNKKQAHKDYKKAIKIDKYYLLIPYNDEFKY